MQTRLPRLFSSPDIRGSYAVLSCNQNHIKRRQKHSPKTSCTSIVLESFVHQFQVRLDAVNVGGFHCSFEGSMNRFLPPLATYAASFAFCLSRASRTAFVKITT